MGDKWTTSGGWRLKSKQRRTFGARTSRKSTEIGSMIVTTATTNTKTHIPLIHPLLRKRNGGVQGGYSAYADPIARRAIVVSTDPQMDNASYPNHPIHPSRLQGNIRRRIRDSSQRSEIIAHYNPEAKDSFANGGGREYTVQASEPGHPFYNGFTSFRNESHSPQLAGTPVFQYMAHPNHEQFMYPFGHGHCDPNFISRFGSGAIRSTHEVSDIPIKYSEYPAGQSDFMSEHNALGIPQFQGKRNFTPQSASSIKDFYIPVSNRPLLTAIHDPMHRQIVPFDNFISPSEQQNLDFHLESIQDGVQFENDVFLDSFMPPGNERNPLTFENLSQRPRSVYSERRFVQPSGGFGTSFGDDHDQPGISHDQPFIHSVNYQAAWAFVPPAVEGLTILDQSGAVPYSEPIFKKTFDDLVPPFRDHAKIQTNHPTLQVIHTCDGFQKQHHSHENPQLTNPSLDGKCSDSSATPIPIVAYPVVRNPKPFNAPNEIRFFNEGIEVDISNRPLSRPNSSVVSKTKVDVSRQQNHGDSDDDFDLAGKTSLWGGK